VGFGTGTSVGRVVGREEGGKEGARVGVLVGSGMGVSVGYGVGRLVTVGAGVQPSLVTSAQHRLNTDFVPLLEASEGTQALTGECRGW
jgi:hypothetical protein